MKIAYLILAHKYPQQLNRLLSKLNDENVYFFLHIDARVKQDFTAFFSDELLKKIYWIKREKTYWGSMGIVTATLNGLRAIVQDPKQFDYVSLLSGQDYPIKNTPFITDFLEKNYPKNFIEYFSLPNPIWTAGGMDRISKYFVGNWACPSTFEKKMALFLNQLASKSDLFKRKFPSYLQPYGGWQWWTLTHEAVRYIVEFCKKHPDYLRFHTFSQYPDELFFQTILLNAPTWLRETLINDNKRYMNWQAGHPTTINKDYFKQLMVSEKLFARKFDANVDKSIFDLIDKYL